MVFALMRRQNRDIDEFRSGLQPGGQKMSESDWELVQSVKQVALIDLNGFQIRTSETELARVVAAEYQWKVLSSIGTLKDKRGIDVAGCFTDIAEAMERLGWFLRDEQGGLQGLHWKLVNEQDLIAKIKEGRN